ncbi:MAG: hypothetical protein JO170_29730 [Verrucomicrobia bacterium]|nr:hypothetical protein [Verrucomicrobiota bacterium]
MVDLELGPQHLRPEILKEVTFQTDGAGKPLAKPVTLLLVSTFNPSPEKAEVSLFARERRDANGREVRCIRAQRRPKQKTPTPSGRDGGSEWRRTNEWHCPEDDPSLDVAISTGAPGASHDHMILDRGLALTPGVGTDLDVGVGDEVFITGLFANYAGLLKNVPIVRVGNLAAYPEERIRIRNFGEMDAYLIEARSIGGLSGSPVFYHSSSVRIRNGQPMFAKGAVLYLIGIVHGHYIRNLDANSEATDAGDIEALNTGISIVVPIGKILSFLDTVQSRQTST